MSPDESPFNVSVIAEIGPDVPDTEMFDWTLFVVNSGILIAAGFEKTVAGAKGADGFSTTGFDGGTSRLNKALPYRLVITLRPAITEKVPMTNNSAAEKIAIRVKRVGIRTSRISFINSLTWMEV